MNDWKNELNKFYKALQPDPIFSSKDQVTDFLVCVVTVTFEEISNELRQYAKNIKIKRYVSKVSISFEDEIAKRSVFTVSIDMKYQTISFPHTLNGTTTYTSGVKIKNRNELKKELIVAAFMEFFLSRKEKLKEIEKIRNLPVD
ncbi:hypothetical protein [Cellvibrio sp. UBA7671]|uniref:hypothetical protein n=1 Tax=Cellvibrio sp. UBA7671 TaxID=1946312 RepID=UPI002F350104